MTFKLKNYIESIIFEELDRQKKKKLTEAFVSNTMRELVKYTFPNQVRGNLYPGNKGGIVPVLSRFGINADEVTDDQCGKKQSGGVDFSKQNKNALVVIVHDAGYSKDKTPYIAAVLVGGKHIVARNYGKEAYGGNWYARNTDDKSRDPKYIRNQRDKYNRTGVIMPNADADSRSLSDRSGMSAHERMSFETLNTYQFFYIFKADNSSISMTSTPNGEVGDINHDYAQSVKSQWEIIAQKKDMYDRIIKQMRAEGRSGELPKELAALGDRFLTLGTAIKTYVDDIVSNPASKSTSLYGSRSGITTSTVHNGRNAVVHTTDMLREYVRLFKLIQTVEDKFKGGNELNKINEFRDALALCQTLEKFFNK